MKAAVFYGPPGSWPQKPLKIEDVPTPKIGPKDVLVKIAACGLCHTDLLYMKMGMRPPKEPPLILGHEPSGVIEEVGEAVTNLKKGQKVLVGYTIPCGECEVCRAGRENICISGDVIGATRDGAFAEYLAVPAKVVVPLPEGIPLQEAAVITDAVAAPYHAVVNVAQVKPGDTVAVFGASGGLGLNVVQIAKAFGANVIGVARRKWKLEKAKEFGASEIISTLEVEKPEIEIRKMTNGGVDIAIDATGSPQAVEMACRSVRNGGKVVVVGYGIQNFTVPFMRFLWYELKVMGSCRYKPSDLFRVVEMVRKGMIKIEGLVSHRFSLEEINKGYEMLDKGEVLRAIAIP